MTVLRHEPDHLAGHRPAPRPHAVATLPQVRFEAHQTQPRVDVYKPRRNIRVDTMFWQHRSPFVGTQEQLDELRRDADRRAADRSIAQFHAYIDTLKTKAAVEAEESVLVVHRPVFKRLMPVVHVSVFPMIWPVTSCRCGERWPCNDMKVFVRKKIGWNRDFDEGLHRLTADLPKPETRWTRFKRWINKKRRKTDRPRTDTTESDRDGRESDARDGGPRGHVFDLPRPSPRRRIRDCDGLRVEARRASRGPGWRRVGLRAGVSLRPNRRGRRA